MQWCVSLLVETHVPFANSVCGIARFMQLVCNGW